MPEEGQYLQFSVRVVSIIISTMLLIISLIPEIRVAVCQEANGESTSVSLQKLVDLGDKYGIAVYWFLWGSIVLNFARLATLIAVFRANKTCSLFSIADIATSIMVCSIVITATITILCNILKSDICEFKDGASPFVGLLVASSGTMLSTTIFELFTLISVSASPYQELAVQQQQDEMTALAMTGCGDSTSNSGLHDIQRMEIESLNSELEMAMEEADRSEGEGVTQGNT